MDLTSIGFFTPGRGHVLGGFAFCDASFPSGFSFWKAPRGSVSRGRHGLRPELSLQAPHRKRFRLKEQSQQLQSSTHNTAQTTRGKLAHGTLAPLPGEMGCG